MSGPDGAQKLRWTASGLLCLRSRAACLPKNTDDGSSCRSLGNGVIHVLGSVLQVP